MNSSDFDFIVEVMSAAEEFESRTGAEVFVKLKTDGQCWLEIIDPSDGWKKLHKYKSIVNALDFFDTKETP